MAIWQKEFTLEVLNNTHDNMVKYLGITFINFGDNFLEASMPVDHRTKQPFGLLHGGASVVLAESLGSLAGHLCIKNPNFVPVGQEINANHLKAVSNGIVTGKAIPFHIGLKSHVWGIEIYNEKKALVCISRLTLAIIEKTNT